MTNPLVNYEESNDNEESQWSFKDFKKYYIHTYNKVHGGGVVPWTIKEQALLSKVIREFETAKTDLADMILWWHINTHRSSVACQFTNFYSNRVMIYEKAIKDNQDYAWN